MLYPQHGMDIQLLSDVGIRSIQMGQSPNVSGGRWKSFSSCTILDRLIIYRECLGYLDVTTLRPFYNVRLYWLEDHPINWSLQYIRFGQICQAPWSKSKGYQERETMGYQEQGNDDTRIFRNNLQIHIKRALLLLFSWKIRVINCSIFENQYAYQKPTRSFTLSSRWFPFANWCAWVGWGLCCVQTTFG